MPLEDHAHQIVKLEEGDMAVIPASGKKYKVKDGRMQDMEDSK